MKVEYPTPEEQRTAAARIAELGLTHRSLFAEMGELRRSLGLRVIFRGQAEVLFLALAAICCTVYYLLGLRHSLLETGSIFCVLFTASPALYLLLCLLGLWKERLSSVFDMKMTCKYTVCHLTVFRMLTFSCVSIVWNLAAAAACTAAGLCTDFWRMFMVSSSGLFLFSALLLYSLLPGGLLVPSLAAAAWVPVNFFFSRMPGGIYGRFLETVPLPLHIAVTAFCAVLYICGLKKLCLRKKENSLC